MKKKKRSYTVYFGGERFAVQHLIGHAWLAEAIYEKSHGRFRCVLPQDAAELRGRSARGVRDANLRTLVACDLALFSVDGPELDGATIVEFVYSKFADVPALLLRSDAHSGSDHATDPSLVLANGFPRTVRVVVPSSTEYHDALRRRHHRLDHALRLAGQHSSAAAQLVCERVAAQCVRAFDRLLGTDPTLPKHLREEAYQWLALAPGLRGKAKELRKEFEQYLERKVEKDLL